MSEKENNSQNITVIVPARNEALKIEQCLQAVLGQSYPPAEVFVVDAYSKDKTVEIAERYPVKVFYNKHLIRAGACQVGVDNAKSSLVAFVDADCVPEKDWLNNLVREMDDDVIGLAGATKFQLSEKVWERSIGLALGTVIGSGDSVQWRIYHNKHQIKSPSGCNSIYRKQAIQEAGGFNVGISGGEDEDLNRRLGGKGKIYYIPDAIVWHNHKMNGLWQFCKRMRLYGKWKIESGAWALRAFPPSLLVPLLLIVSIFQPLVFLAAAGLYLLITLFFSLMIAVRERQIVYLFTVPVVYTLGHVSFTIGLWQELLRPRRFLKWIKT